MPRTSDPSDTLVRRVRSDLAEPSRPGGRHGVRQPMEPETPDRPQDAPATDRDLVRNVMQALQQEGRLNCEDIVVAARQGVVTLSGTVDSEFQRSLATAVVEPLAGVLVVENDLRPEHGQDEHPHL